MGKLEHQKKKKKKYCQGLKYMKRVNIQEFQMTLQTKFNWSLLEVVRIQLIILKTLINN